MDEFRLRVFVTAARTLSFSKCAAALNITQPAVSRHIGELGTVCRCSPAVLPGWR